MKAKYLAKTLFHCFDQSINDKLKQNLIHKSQQRILISRIHK